MKKIIIFLSTMLISNITCQFSIAQVINFTDDNAAGIFKLENISFYKFNSKNVYNHLFDDKEPAKYYAMLKFGRRTFELNLFDLKSNQALEGIYPIFDSFLKVDDKNQNTEHYVLKNGQNIDVKFQSWGQYSGDWIEGLLSVLIVSKSVSNPGKSDMNFLGTGSFIYNTKTHDIRTK